MSNATLAVIGFLTVQILTTSALAADAFPRSGIFTEPESESELDFAKRYLGFPDEECSFKSPKKLKANSWRITTTCRTADPAKTEVSTATLERRGKTWRLTRGGFVMVFEPPKP